MGIGIGLPYGAFGLRGGTNVVDRLNLFGGLGYHLSGLDYTFCLRKEFSSSLNTQFYLLGRYGSSVAIKIIGVEEYNKVYVGLTFGLGMKINARKAEGNYWYLGLLLPLRSSSDRSAEETVKNDPRVASLVTTRAVVIAVGYNFFLPKR